MAPATTAATATAATKMEKCRVDWLLRQLTHRRTASCSGEHRPPTLGMWGLAAGIRTGEGIFQERWLLDGGDVLPSGMRSCGGREDVGRLVKKENVDPGAGRCATHTPPPITSPCSPNPSNARNCLPNVLANASGRLFTREWSWMETRKWKAGGCP